MSQKRNCRPVDPAADPRVLHTYEEAAAFVRLTTPIFAQHVRRGDYEHIQRVPVSLGKRSEWRVCLGDLLAQFCGGSPTWREERRGQAA